MRDSTLSHASLLVYTNTQRKKGECERGVRGGEKVGPPVIMHTNRCYFSIHLASIGPHFLCEVFLTFVCLFLFSCAATTNEVRYSYCCIFLAASVVFFCSHTTLAPSLIYLSPLARFGGSSANWSVQKGNEKGMVPRSRTNPSFPLSLFIYFVSKREWTPWASSSAPYCVSRSAPSTAPYR